MGGAVLWLLFSALPQAGAAATQTGSTASDVVRGSVVNAATGAPLAGVLVTLADLDRRDVTDAAGRFEFTGVPPGRHTLTASSVGFAFSRRDIVVGGDLATRVAGDLVVPLTEGAGAYQETVTVSADAARGGAPGTSAGGEANSATLQDLRGIAADDPLRAVQALPGVVTGDDFQSEFSVRGSAFRQVGVLLDGAEAPTLLHAVRGADDTGSIAMINTDVVSHASLLAGAHPRKMGDWVGATLMFDVREGSRDRVAFRAAVSGTSASTVFEGPIGRDGRGSWLVSARKSYIDWLIRTLERDIDSTIGFADGLAKVVFDVAPSQQVQLLVAGGDAVYREVATSQANGILRATSGSTLASATWRLTRGRGWTTQRVTFYGSDFRNTGALAQSLARGYWQSVGWSGHAAMTVGAGWTVEGGATRRSERLNQILREYTSVRAGVIRERDRREVTASFDATSVWAQAQRETTGSSLAVGLRGTSRTDAPRGALLPWLLAERRAERWTWRAGLGASAQFADPTLVAADGAPAPPERAAHVDLGVEHRFTSTWRWSVTAFARRDADGRRRVGEARLDPVTGAAIAPGVFPTYSSRLRGDTTGVDLLLLRRAPSGLTGWLSYTWAHTRHHDTSTDETYDGDFDQRHTFNAFAQQRLSHQFSVGAKLRIGSNTPLVGYFEPDGALLRLSARRNQSRLPVYARLDLRATRTWVVGRRRLTLFAEVMNALGRRNLRQSDASIRATGEAVSYAERLLPLVPSAGFLIEW